jgi:hypothetical protein
MKKNIGNIDVIIRVIIGLGLVAAGILYESWWGLLGFIPLVTGFFGICPLYTVFGISTCPHKHHQHHQHQS